MEYKTCLTFVFIITLVCCEKGVNKDSETLLVGDFGACQAKHKWIFHQTSPSIDDQRNISNILTPSAQTTCLASSTLSLVSGGILEAQVNSQSRTNEDNLTILVFGEEDNNVVGQATLLEGENGLTDGDHVLKVILGGAGHYNGFIMIIAATLNPDIRVESLCLHHPPAQQQEKSSENTSHTSHYGAPDMYTLQTGSILKYTVHPNENEGNVDTRVAIKNRSFWIFDREDFWTPLTISLAVVIPVIFLALICWACFALGKCKGAKQDPQMIYEDIDNLPKPYLVPRVKSVYSESAAGSTYGGGNNNIYSV